MDKAYAALLDFPFFKVLLLALALPVLIILIFRSERYFAMLEYQLFKAKKAFTRVDS